MAVMAEDERRRISERTKAALAAAKRRGVKLGGDRGARLTAKQRALGRRQRHRLCHPGTDGDEASWLATAHRVCSTYPASQEA